MKHILLTTIAAVVLVGCGESQPPEPPKGKAPDISIHKAVALGNIKAVKQHLATGTDVNTKDLTGFAPLVFAASIGHKEIAKLLIAKGADVNVKNSGKTPLDWAIKQNHTETAELLRKHGGKRGSELPLATLFEAVKQVDLQGVKDFLAKGADVNAKDWDGWTSLDNAISNGHKEIVELLIASGADVNAKDGDGWTPLFYAVYGGHLEIVELLITRGADVNAVYLNNSVLDQTHSYDDQEMVELLEAHGAEVADKVSGKGDGKGKSAFLSITNLGDGDIIVEFDSGILQTANSINGPWEDVDEVSPVTWTADQFSKFARLKFSK